ncbi:hypothetical protein [Methylobacterium sp. P5_C11]
MISDPFRRARVAGAICAALALLFGIGAREACAQPSPLSVNDCTLLPDPSALRRCLDQAEGRVIAPLPPVAGPAAPERPEQSVQAARGTAAAKPGPPPQTDFLGNRLAPAPSARPSSRTVIDLE